MDLRCSDKICTISSWKTSLFPPTQLQIQDLGIQDFLVSLSERLFKFIDISKPDCLLDSLLSHTFKDLYYELCGLEMILDHNTSYHFDNDNIKNRKTICPRSVDIKIEVCQQRARCGDLRISLGYADRVTL